VDPKQEVPDPNLENQRCGYGSGIRWFFLALVPDPVWTSPGSRIPKFFTISSIKSTKKGKNTWYYLLFLLVRSGIRVRDPASGMEMLRIRIGLRNTDSRYRYLPYQYRIRIRVKVPEFLFSKLRWEVKTDTFLYLRNSFRIRIWNFYFGPTSCLKSKICLKLDMTEILYGNEELNPRLVLFKNFENKLYDRET
jgi:hypothetical protein